MTKRTIEILALLLFPAMCFPQVRPRPTGQPSTPPAYMQQLTSFDQEGSLTRVVFKNGLTVLVGEAHANSLVEVLTWIKAGYRDDPSDLPGISRLMEHMLLRGTATRSAAAMAADLKSLGGTATSAMAYDHTSFGVTVPAVQWKRALELQADILLNPLLDPEELKRQVEAIAGESRYEVADQEVLADAKLLETGFAGDRLARGRLVPAESLSKITRDKLLTFFQSSYSPGRAVLIVCGDVITSEVLGEVARLYSKAKGGAAGESNAPGKDVQPGFRYAQVRGTDKTARIFLGFRTVPADSPDYPALEVLRAMLGTGEGAILNRRLKNQKRLIFSAAADQAAFVDTGYLRLRMELDPKDVDRCEIAAFTEFEILKRQEPDEAEVERARAQLEREFWETSLAVFARADRLGRFESIGAWKGVDGYLARLEKTKWADVIRVATRYLRLDNCALLEYLPAQSEARNISAGNMESTIKDLLAPAAAQEIAEREKVTVPALDMPAAASFKPTEIRYPFQMASILRGPELFIREDHTIPFIHLGLFFAGGRMGEAKANAGITALMLRTMLRDSKNMSADQIYRQLGIYGATITPVIRDDYFGVYFSISSASVEPGLDILSEMIKSPKLDPEEIERQKRLQLAALRLQSDRDTALQRFREALFKDHPYGLSVDGTEESLANLTPEAVQVWHKLNVADRKPMVVIIGDTQGTNLAGYFVKNFSGSRFQDAKIPEGFVKALESKAAIEANWDAGASLITVGFQAPPEGDDDSFPLEVLQSYASGLAGRLGDRVQQSVRSASCISLDYEPELRGGSITASLTVTPQDDEQALKALVSEIQRLATAPITYRDYRSAVNAATGEILIRQQNRFGQIADMVKSVVAGKGIDGFQDDVDRLQEVKQTDLQEVAQRVFKIDKSVTLRLHGKSAP